MAKGYNMKKQNNTLNEKIIHGAALILKEKIFSAKATIIEEDIFICDMIKIYGQTKVSKMILSGNKSLKGVSPQRLNDFYKGREKFSWEKITNICEAIINHITM
jgi:hypothetical protein